MAVVSVSDSNNRAEDMEGTPTVTDIGAGAGGGKETVTFYEGLASISRKVTNTTLRGTGTTVGTPVDMTAGDNTTWLSKTFLSDYLDVNSVGCLVRLGDTTANTYDYILFDDGTLGDRGIGQTLPPSGGWLIAPVNPNVTAWRDAVNGSPTLTAVDVFQVGCGLATGAAKAENIFIDAIDIGDGLYLVGGDGGGSADGVFQDFVDYDEGEGSTTADRAGHVTTKEGIIYVFGKLIIGRTSAGTVTATEFTDANKTIVFPGGRVAAGWNEIEVDCGNAATRVTISSCSFVGRGRDNIKVWFDSELDVTGSIVLFTTSGVSHDFQTGDAVAYSNEGGTSVGGLTSGNEYFVRRASAVSFTLHSNRAGAYANTSLVTLTAAGAGNGQNHSFRRQPDTRPELNATGTSGVAGFSGCSLISFKGGQITSAVTLNAGTSLIRSGTLDLNQGKLSNASVSQSTVDYGEASIETADPSDITGTEFEAGARGHAIEATAAGTYSFTGNTFTGYGPAAQTFDTETDVTGGATDTIAITGHPYTTGDAVFYADDGGTETIGLTDDAMYYVRSIDANTIALFLSQEAAASNTNRVNLTASGVGNGETHSLYSANAAFHNSSGGLVTLNVSDGDSPSVRNSAGSSTTVNATVAVTLTGLKDNTEVRVFSTGTTTELDGIEDATAGSPDNRSFTFSLAAGTGVDIRIINVQYQYLKLTNYIVPSSATSVPIQQIFDRQYENP
jgi:hypothetical protein